jgi:hypothetical protein
MNMMKKAGIIVAAAATGVLAVSGLAFADTTSGNVGNDCAFGNASGDASQGIFGGEGLLGAVAGVFTGLTTNAATQANAANCTNVQLKDLIDNGSGNTDESITKREIEGSYNH